MARRRRSWGWVVAVGVGAALVAFGRPFGADPTGAEPPREVTAPPAADRPAAGAPPAATDRAPATTSGPGTPVATPSNQVHPPHDHGGVTGEETIAPAAAAQARRAAERFAAIWSRPDPRWHARLAALATPAFADSLAGAGPPEPAVEITGSGQLYLEAPDWARVGVPARGGTVVLDLVAAGDRWLVAALDWWPG